MKLIITVITAVIFLSVNNLFSQTIEGKITSSGDAVPFVNIVIKELKLGVSADEKGNYSFSGIPEGSYSIIASSIGMESNIRNYDIKSGVNIINMYQI